EVAVADVGCVIPWQLLWRESKRAALRVAARSFTCIQLAFVRCQRTEPAWCGSKSPLLLMEKHTANSLLCGALATNPTAMEGVGRDVACRPKSRRCRLALAGREM